MGEVNKKHFFSIKLKLISIFLLTSFIIFSINLLIYNNMNTTMTQIDQSYISNKSLMELKETLEKIQSNMKSYLYDQNSNVLSAYQQNIDTYNEQLKALNGKIVDNKNLLMERSIKNISYTYIDTTQNAIDAKLGRNIELYQQNYNDATNLYDYLNTRIYILNNSQFEDNTKSYSVLLSFVHKTELINLTILLIAIALCILLILILTNRFTTPLKQLALAANRIGKGDFDLDIKITPSKSEDEINVVIMAFNKMIVSLKEHIIKLKKSIELESKLKEKELLIESNLKDAQLKYLQAQINPHFLFNTLNAGAQLAMMEEADATYEYIHKVADFFRYNVKKNNGVSTIREEIELIDNYIYILNVRFSGDIHYNKVLDESLLDLQVPSMFLQPIIENCIKHGLSNVTWDREIYLCIQREDKYICITIEDNGIGMSKDCINSILSNDKSLSSDKQATNSGSLKGIGINNVIERLRLFYGYTEVMTITSEGKNKGTKVSMYINKA